MRRIDSCITQLKAQGPSRTYEEINEEELITDKTVTSRFCPWRSGIRPWNVSSCFLFAWCLRMGLVAGTTARARKQQQCWRGGHDVVPAIRSPAPIGPRALPPPPHCTPLPYRFLSIRPYPTASSLFGSDSATSSSLYAPSPPSSLLLSRLELSDTQSL